MNYYKNKTVLVTGATGFVGRYLVAALKASGAKVIAPLHKYYDLTQRSHVITLACNHPKVDILFHLAANVGGINYNKDNPADLLHDNLMMGLNILDEAAKLWFPERVVFAGSVCAYPLYAPIPTFEHHLWTGYPEPTNGPYGVAKLVVGEALQAYHRQYKQKAAYLVFANMYGPGTKVSEKSHVIPALVDKFLHAKANGDPTVEVWGTGRASRDFLYVTDAVRALLMAGERVDVPVPLNISTNHEVTVAYLANKIAELTGYEGQLIFDTSKPDGQPRRCFRNDAAKKVLGWTPRIGIDEGLKRTVEWYAERMAYGQSTLDKK